MRPVLFWLGPLPVYSYGVFSAVGLLVGFLWARREFRRRHLPGVWLWRLMPRVALCAFVGARLLHVTAHWQDYNTFHALLWRWRPGMSFHGAMLGSIAGVWWTAKRFDMPMVVLLDALTPSAPLGHAIGRVGCFFNGCCYGKPTKVPWAVRFRNPTLRPGDLTRHPTQIYEAFGLFLLFGLLVRWSPRKVGERFWLWLGGYGILRFITEFWREGTKGTWLRLTYPQWLSVALMVLAFFRMTLTKSPQAKRFNKNPSHDAGFGGQVS